MAIRKTISRIDREGIITDSRIEVGTLVHTMSGDQISMPTLCWRWISGKFRSIDDPLELDFFHFLVLDPLSLAFNLPRLVWFSRYKTASFPMATAIGGAV